MHSQPWYCSLSFLTIYRLHFYLPRLWQNAADDNYHDEQLPPATLQSASETPTFPETAEHETPKQGAADDNVFSEGDDKTASTQTILNKESLQGVDPAFENAEASFEPADTSTPSPVAGSIEKERVTMPTTPAVKTPCADDDNEPPTVANLTPAAGGGGNDGDYLMGPGKKSPSRPAAASSSRIDGAEDGDDASPEAASVEEGSTEVVLDGTEPDEAVLPAADVVVAKNSFESNNNSRVVGEEGREEDGGAGGGEEEESDHIGVIETPAEKAVEQDDLDDEAVVKATAGGDDNGDSTVAGLDPAGLTTAFGEGVKGGDGGGIAEDFFADGVSSGEDEIFPAVLAASNTSAVDEGGVGNGIEHAGHAGRGTRIPDGEQPPSPRIIAPSQIGFGAGRIEVGDDGFGYSRSPAATHRKTTTVGGGGGGLSEAAKAAVAAALANATSSAGAETATGRSSRKDDDGAKTRKKKKSHKEKRKKGSSAIK